MSKRKAVVAMSGGVDSSVAAALLVEQGFDVTGIMLKLWRGEAANTDSGCCNVGAAEDARRVADVLGIPFYVLNFAEQFEETVIRDFHDSYSSGLTPNPCVRCNQWVKFGTLLERADALGADVLATGHYARVRRDGGRFRLLRGVDPGKDQSYVLWMLSQDQLRRTLFPVGEMHKSETRRIAGELGLRTAAKPDSQEICFVRGGDLGAYIDESLPESAVPGPILDAEGREIGAHKGIGRYTIGQRKGLGISLGVPVYVTGIDAEAGSITVGGSEDLLIGGVVAGESSFVGRAPESGERVLVQYRSHGDVFPARVEQVEGESATLDFENPVSAVAPGQSIAFYTEDSEELLGGGVIASTVPARAGVS
ncbi:MAG TPA: tRNA 2-thiouridine(34) synthase MnmA [Actinomycetota bacterium]|nr:tRNA 2-thiouridine(34) synthase MnmA [Actinomycetota bacterium]